MKINGYYTSGEFAKKAHVSVRTIRFYDKQNILKPSFVNESGARFYSDSDFARLQQVLLLKYLGFSLEDIKNMTISDTDTHMLLNSLRIQQKLVQDKIEQMQLVEKAIRDTSNALEQNNCIDWSNMLDIIHLTGMENSLKTQYQNANNISARIRLHQLYSVNKQGWFSWIYDQCINALSETARIYPDFNRCASDFAYDAALNRGNCNNHIRILETGCGNGAFWLENIHRLPQNATIILSDISEGMLRDARRSLAQTNTSNFDFNMFDCENIPYDDESFDLIIANHVLFYCNNLDRACSEIKRVLKHNGTFICSTYGTSHMQEISRLVNEFDGRIVLSANKLYEKFGLENGAGILSPYFSHIEKKIYDDCLKVDKPEPLIEYILSCHGNQNQYLTDRYKDFREFITKKTKKTLTITKDAGIFVCKISPS